MPDDPLIRIAEALELLAPSATPRIDLSTTVLHRFDGRSGRVVAAPDFALPLDLLAGVERQKGEVLALLRRFAAGVSTNHALLWGARGAGKSSLVKAAVMAVAGEAPALKLVEVSADHLDRLPELFGRLEAAAVRVVLLCDDLSFEEGAAGAKALKSTLEGGVAGPPDNVLVVATSNRRHLMPRSHDQADPTASAEDAEESLSMSDRFGVWLGFRRWISRPTSRPCAPTPSGSTCRLRVWTGARCSGRRGGARARAGWRCSSFATWRERRGGRGLCEGRAGYAFQAGPT